MSKGELRKEALEAVEAEPSDGDAWELLERITVKLIAETGLERMPALPDRLQRIWKARNDNCRLSFEENAEMGAMIDASDAEAERSSSLDN